LNPGIKTTPLRRFFKTLNYPYAAFKLNYFRGEHEKRPVQGAKKPPGGGYFA
jgi:hypothetical protein